MLIWIANTKMGICIYTKIQPFPFAHVHLIIEMMCLYFQDVSELNDIHVPFTIGYKPHLNYNPWFH